MTMLTLTLPPVTTSLHAQVAVPGSKSLTNRALLLAGLAQGVSVLSGILVSDDTCALIGALRALGIMIQVDEAHQSCIVVGCGGRFPKQEAQIDCHDAGTVARFLLAVCAAQPGRYMMVGSEQLSRRPMSGLVHALRRQRVQIEASPSDGLPIKVLGLDALPGGGVQVDAEDSGQFVSALLMAAPFAATTMTIELLKTVSVPFIDMTIDVMGAFGVRANKRNAGCYAVPVPQHYQPCDYTVEPDLSTAACFLAAAAVVGGEVSIQPVDLIGSSQGDARFPEILQQMGCEVIPSQGGLRVCGASSLQGVSVNMRDFSDTFMALAAIAPFASTPTTITHIAHTRKQESDRIQAMYQGLEAMGVRVEQGPDWLRIYPGIPQQAEIDSCGDHRIAMAFALAGLRCGVTIRGAECVSKTCPDFFSLWAKMCRS